MRPLSPFSLNDISIRREIKAQQRIQSEQALKKFIRKHVSGCGISCSLAEVRDALIRKGVREERLTHDINDLREHMEMRSGDTVLELYHPLFPKDKSETIRFTVSKIMLSNPIEAKSAPEGVADFILAVEEWLPEYYMIEEQILAAEKQRTLACDIALDLLRRTIGEKLEQKGYKYDLRRIRNTGKANIQIRISKILNMSFEIDLMGDFLDQITGIIDSLPVNVHNEIPDTE